MESRRTATVLWLVIVVSLAVHVFFLIAGHTFLSDWRWVHHPVHASVEFSGSLIAYLVAAILIGLERRNEGTAFNNRIAGALIGMGTLDGFHALVHAGQAFVWLHSTATFVGGALFATVWLPLARWRRIGQWWLYALISLAFTFGLLSVARSDLIPTMVVAGKFTLLAQWLNISGGVLFFAAAVRLMRSYFQGQNVDDLLFCLHCFLFGGAAVMFEQSDLWDAPWWGWHSLRLMAYGVALLFVVRTELQAQNAMLRLTTELKELNENLEQRVDEMTAELRVRYEEIQRANEQLSEHSAALERSNEELKQFAYVASHDLQEPLRKVASFCQLLKDRYADQLDEAANEYIDFAVDGARRMKTLINDLLALSRLTSRGQALEPVDAQRACEEAISNLQEAIDTSGANLQVGRLPTIRADSTQLMLLFQNLISNAIKYRGEQVPDVTVAAESNGGHWVISVKDNGIGIDARFAEQIFVIFKRLHSHDEYSGTGIGLAICKKIVERMNGRIWMESATGSGSVFYFTVPILEPHEL